MGAGTGATTAGELAAAIAWYGRSYYIVPDTLTPQPSAELQVMRNAVAAGNPVIAFVHGADLGRPTAGNGQPYGDHWIVVRGFSSDGQSVYVNDPDNEAAHYAGWIVGGQITLPIATFQNAMYHAAAGPYGIVVY